VCPIAQSGDVLGLDIENFLHSEAAITHQSDRYLLFESFGIPRQHFIFAP